MTTQTASPPKLNTRQHQVVLYVYTGMSQTEAYEKVYGPNPNSRFLASQLLNTPHVKDYLEALNRRKEELIIANEVNSVASPIERKQVLTELLRAKLVDFIDEDGRVKTLSTDIPHHAALSEYSVTSIGHDDGEQVTKRSLKLRDPIAAISELNKMEHIYETDTKNIYNDIKVLIVREKPRQLNQGETVPSATVPSIMSDSSKSDSVIAEVVEDTGDNPLDETIVRLK